MSTLWFSHGQESVPSDAAVAFQFHHFTKKENRVRGCAPQEVSAPLRSIINTFING